eukprot:CAMPEP_0195521604 /NCGR_PEP_ID=MMETSP0794_2-20130614/19030_1 /TAXON_ID=515487 /ORGANISM="Stephanopyxis turris, Strain CCMP 815" /LENGTH=242 /DNA_ID=CAMNT_0040651189 /DNA_START=328 /DNA_END=1056 /DNA_ORIENTATION=+
MTTFVARPMTQLYANKDDEDAKSVSFDDASVRLSEEEEAMRAEKSGGGLTEEQVSKFESKKTEYDSMRERIRARASSLDIEKSVATAKAIEEANARAIAREEPSSSPEAFGSVPAGAEAEQSLNLDAIMTGGVGEDNAFGDLTDEEREEIEQLTKINIIAQVKDELSNAKWPTVGATLRQTAFMFFIFLVTAGYVLKLDEIVRTVYTDAGLIPRPDEVYDFSDLTLPDSWTDNMDSNDLMNL